MISSDKIYFHNVKNDLTLKIECENYRKYQICNNLSLREILV